MDYEASVPFSGDSPRAIQAAVDVLMATNMRINSRTDSTLNFSGPGMNSTKENPLVGISIAQISISGGNISIRADLNAIRRLILIASTVVIALEVPASIVFVIFTRGKMPTATMIGIMMMWIVPWAIILPALAIWAKQRTSRAIDTLLHNMTLSSTQQSLPGRHPA